MLRRRDDRLDVALMHAPDDELEQIPHVPTALLLAGCHIARVTASPERGNHFVDESILGAGKDC